MEHTEIDSSVLASAAYDDERLRLEIHFRTGRVYHYKEVPRAVYEELLTSESPGKYFNEVIRPSYECELVYDPHRPRVR